jgi:hypothetical protein
MRPRTEPTPKAAASLKDRSVVRAPLTLAATSRQEGQDGRPDDTVASLPSLSAAMLVALASHLPCGVIVLDTAGRVVFTNEAGTRLFRDMQLGDGSVAGNVLPGHLNSSPQLTHGMLIARALAGDAVPEVDYVLGVQAETLYRVVQAVYTSTLTVSTVSGPTS